MTMPLPFWMTAHTAGIPAARSGVYAAFMPSVHERRRIPFRAETIIGGYKSAKEVT